MLQRVAALKQAHVDYPQPCLFEDWDDPWVIDYEGTDPIDIAGY